jgi:hypothetical protein
MDESFQITPDPEQVALGQKRELLRNQLAKLYEERAFAIGSPATIRPGDSPD